MSYLHSIIANASGLNIHVENYQDYSDEIT